jgi:solute:Na+ symporter, SSS family
MIITVTITTAVWLAVTFLTRPESKETLVAFYRRTHPSAAGWRPIARLAPDVRPSAGGLYNLLDWICGCVLIYGVLFGTGKLLLKEFALGSSLMAAGLIAGAIIYWDLSRRGWSAVVD